MEPLDYLNLDLDQFQTDINNTITPNYIGITRAFAPPVTQEQLRSIDRTGVMKAIDPGFIPELYDEVNKMPAYNTVGFQNTLRDIRNDLRGIPTVARLGALAFGPLGFIGGLLGTSIADKLGFTQAARDRKARETAAMRGSVKDLQSRIDRGDFGGRDSGDAPSGPASNQDAARGGQYG